MTTLELGKRRAEELGLKWVTKDGTFARFNKEPIYYQADDIHRLLGEAQTVYTTKILKTSQPKSWDRDEIYGTVEDMEEGRGWKHTHQALLIGIKPIKPIKQESPERALLREMINSDKTPGGSHWCFPQSWLDKAKKLLEEG